MAIPAQAKISAAILVGITAPHDARNTETAAVIFTITPPSTPMILPADERLCAILSQCGNG
jgi:hypothetical protein